MTAIDRVFRWFFWACVTIIVVGLCWGAGARVAGKLKQNATNQMRDILEAVHDQ